MLWQGPAAGIVFNRRKVTHLASSRRSACWRMCAESRAEEFRRSPGHIGAAFFCFFFPIEGRRGDPSPSQTKKQKNNRGDLKALDLDSHIIKEEEGKTRNLFGTIELNRNSDSKLNSRFTIWLKSQGSDRMPVTHWPWRELQAASFRLLHPPESANLSCVSVPSFQSVCVWLVNTISTCGLRRGTSVSHAAGLS